MPIEVISIVSSIICVGSAQMAGHVPVEPTVKLYKLNIITGTHLSKSSENAKTGIPSRQQVLQQSCLYQLRPPEGAHVPTIQAAPFSLTKAVLCICAASPYTQGAVASRKSAAGSEQAKIMASGAPSKSLQHARRLVPIRQFQCQSSAALPGAQALCHQARGKRTPPRPYNP